MQASAQIQELQAKYKGNPQKLNQEMAELYKRENYIPDVGCLPLLIQFRFSSPCTTCSTTFRSSRSHVHRRLDKRPLTLPESIINFGNFTGFQ